MRARSENAGTAQQFLGVLRCGMLALCCLMQPAFADEEPRVTTQLVAEVRETLRTPDGRETHRFQPATLLTQGQVVYYTVRIHNPTSVYLSGVEVTQRVPANTRYVPGSAAGPGAEVTISRNGGQTFEPEPQLDPEAAAEAAAQYTHIRWRLRYPLAPGAVALARFRAVFN